MTIKVQFKKRNAQLHYSLTFGASVGICRVCRGEPSLVQPLFHPCKCSGSIRFVHQDW